MIVEWSTPIFSPDLGRYPFHLVWGGGTHRTVDAHMQEYRETDRLKAKGGNLARQLAFS